MTSSAEVKYDFEPWDGTPGTAYDTYDTRLKNFGSKTDDRGWSLSDHLNGVDEGSPLGPAIPGGAIGVKAQAAYRKRQKESYGIVVKNITRKDITDTLTRDHFQNGRNAYTAARGMGVVAIDALRLKELDVDWDVISIIHHIGISESTITLLEQKIRAINSERPAPSRKTEDQMVERFLECIFTCSKHFSEGALIEYQAAAGARQFEHAPPVLNIAGLNTRDFPMAVAHYGPLWRNAVRSKLPGFAKRDPQPLPARATSQTLEQGMRADDPGPMGRETPLTGHRQSVDSARVADDAYVPRSGSPTDSLVDFANAGDELSCRRGTVTTTDWGMLSQLELTSLADTGEAEGCEVCYVFDADDQASVELLCDCCGGAGHLKRVCPSNKNRSRSHAYLIALHQTQMTRKGSAPRRPPGRGQRGPFRAFSRRFQPRGGQPPGWRREVERSWAYSRGGRGGDRLRSAARSAEEGDWELLPLGDGASCASEASAAQSSSASSSRSTEFGGAAREQGQQAIEPKPKAIEPKPFAFSTSDDQLFERGSVAIEGPSVPKMIVDSGCTSTQIPKTVDEAMAGPHAQQWTDAGVTVSPQSGARSRNSESRSEVTCYPSGGCGHSRDGKYESGSSEPVREVPHWAEPLLAWTSVIVAIAAMLLAFFEYISRNCGCALPSLDLQRPPAILRGPHRPVRLSTLLRIVIVVLILIFAPHQSGAQGVTAGSAVSLTSDVPQVDHAPAAPAPVINIVSGAPEVDYAMIGGTHGFVPNDIPGLDVCVDSGCTTTSISETIAHLFPEKRLLEENPNRSLYIADEKGLPIVRVISTELPVTGYNLSKPNVNIRDTLPVSRALIVKGMKPNMILLSTRSMKKDRVNTYLNDDNSIRRSDCLYITESGLVVPFKPSTHAYNIRLDNSSNETECGDSAWIALHPKSARPTLLVHKALGHSGEQRLGASNILIDGAPVKEIKWRSQEHDHTSCKGCRLSNTGKKFTAHIKGGRYKPGNSTKGFEHFGQQMDSDICTGFPASFPHHFTAQVNFIDRCTKDTFLYFLRSANAHEVSSAGKHLQDAITHRLPDGKIGRWVTDNGMGFLGEETEEMGKELCRDRGFQIPNDSDTLPVPERNWGVLQRIIRANISDAEAPQCLWPWAAAQANRLLYYLPTSAHQPPQSPHSFITKSNDPVDLSWARVMFCDCTVATAIRDRDGKLGDRSADACHLGYDPRRGGHFCYVPSLSRLSSFTVSEWREDEFTICKAVTADTPVEYIDAHDLSVAPVTASMLPRRYSGRVGTDRRKLTVVLIFCGNTDADSIAAILKEWGHTVKVYDTQISMSHNLSTPEAQNAARQAITSADFVFLSPPCDTASIAHDPPWRTVFAPKGVRDLSLEARTKIEQANVLYDFTCEAIRMCVERNIRWGLESAASRRAGPAKCQWAKYANHGFLWDYPCIASLANDARYLTFAQCPFGAPWQKYTGLLVDNTSYPTAHRIFNHAQCVCAGHKVVLKGYDESGEARTRLAQHYVPRLAHAFASFIVEACGSNQEGEHGDEWSDALLQTNQSNLVQEIARSATDSSQHHYEFQVGKPLPITKDPPPSPHHLNQTRKPPTAEQEMEFILETADGAYRVSEVGQVTLPTTVTEAKESKWWPLFKKAMEEEMHGKMANRAFGVVKRPQGQHVLKSKWVFTIKYNDDGSIKVVKARFVACGYSQIENSDFDMVFASTLASVAFRTQTAIIADEDLETDHMDAVKAFTQSDVDHLIYVEMPEGFAQEGYVLILYKALEGIKQGAYLWFQHNRSAWVKLGAVSWANEPNLYYFEKLGIRVGVFADDTLVGFPKQHTEEWRAIKIEYSKLIKIDKLEITPVLKFTGVQIERNREEGTITIHMERYIEQLCEEYKGQFKEAELPYGESEKSRRAFDLNENEGKSIGKGEFLQLMGKIVWPSTMVRLDIAMPTSKLCSKASDPYEIHLERGLSIIGYLSATRKMGITYGGRLRIPLGLSEHPPGFIESCGLYVVHDNSFGTCPRPMGGFVVMYNNGAVDWNASALKLVPDSSHEAESAQASRSAKAGIYERQLLLNNGRKVAGPTVCVGDNKSNETTSQQIGSSSRTRYYERAVLLFKRAVLLLILTPLRVSTDNMMADIFTKATGKATFLKMRNAMMNIHGPLRGALEKSYNASSGRLRRLIGSVYDAVDGRS